MVMLVRRVLVRSIMVHCRVRPAAELHELLKPMVHHAGGMDPVIPGLLQWCERCERCGVIRGVGPGDTRVAVVNVAFVWEV